MPYSSEALRLAERQLPDHLGARRATRNLRLIALALGVVATACSAIIGVYSYRASYQLQLDALVRTNVSFAQYLAHAEERDLVAEANPDPLARIEANWAQMPRDNPAMFLCVVSRQGRLLANSHRPEKVGIDISGVILPATQTSHKKTVGELAAERGEWFGENTNLAGQRQLVAFEYAPVLDGLVVVHTPASGYAARVRQSTLPWVVGFVISTMLMWPLGLLIMNRAYDRARQRADRAERHRQTSELLFETIFEQAAIGVALIHTASGRFARINGKYASLIGYTNAEIKAKTWQEITHPDDVQPDLERMELLKRGQLNEFDLQKRLIRGDGSTIWVNLNVSPTWHDDHPEGNYHIAIIEDITERRQATKALAESEHRFRTLVENAPESIVVFDVDQQRFVDFNNNALRMFGVTAEQMGAMTPADVSPEFQPDGRRSSEGSQELLARALAGETPNQEWSHCDGKGNEISTEIRLVRLFATGRRLVRGSITDIRERKRTEEQFRQLQSELAHISRLSVMGEMVAGIAHEINQPLFAISNYAHTCSRVLGKETLKTPEVLEWCRDIEREATRAGEIIRRLRNFTRKGEQPKTPVDVNAAVRETIALLMPDSKQHQVTIDTELAAESVMIEGDIIGLQQVFVNLILNAREALTEFDVPRRLITIRTTPRGGQVEIAVIDNGPGFANGQLDHVFDTFYSTKTDGMGMGLAISRTLVEALGGTLTALNGEERGAILQITLPRLVGVMREEVATSHA